MHFLARLIKTSSTNKICFATLAVSSHGLPISNLNSKMAPSMSKHLYVFTHHNRVAEDHH